MEEMKNETFETGGAQYNIEYKPVDETSLEVAIKADGGEKARTLYKLTPELAVQWSFSGDDGPKFLARFGKYHSRIRAMKGDSGREEYLFDQDFATVKPESVIEKVTKEWEKSAE